uniref:Uncharacterized protein n=1 Tax=Anopheles culicifacies TaxID=139723 RepID=A0A182LXU8_9DIPT
MKLLNGPVPGSVAGITVEVTSATSSVHGLDGTGFVLARNRQQHPHHHHRQRQRHRLHQQDQRPLATTTLAGNASSTSLATERLITFGKIRRYRETSAASPSSRTSPATPSARKGVQEKKQPAFKKINLLGTKDQAAILNHRMLGLEVGGTVDDGGLVKILSRS